MTSVGFAEEAPYLTDSAWDIYVNGQQLPVFESQGMHYIKVNQLFPFGLQASFDGVKREVHLLYTNVPGRAEGVEITDKNIRQIVRKRVGSILETDLKLFYNMQPLPSINVNNEMYLPVSYLKYWGSVNQESIGKRYDVTFSVTALPSFLNTEKELYKLKQGKYYGYVNDVGAFSIQPIFEDAKQFEEGLAAVKIGEKWGYINSQGQIQISAQFESAGSFYEDGAIVSKRNESGILEVGLIGKNGQYLLPLFVGEIRAFQDGYAAIRIGTEQNGKWGFIKEDGAFVIPPSYLQVQDFHQGYTAAQLPSGVWAFLDDDGDVIEKTEFHWASSYGEGYFLVDNGIERFYCDKNGRTKIDLEDVFGDEPSFDYDMEINRYKESFYRGFEDGVAVYRIIGKDGAYQYGLLDEDGDIRKEPFANDIGLFQDGYAVVRFGDESTGKYGIIDESGDLIVAPVYDHVENLYHGKFFVISGDHSMYVSK